MLVEHIIHIFIIILKALYKLYMIVWSALHMSKSNFYSFILILLVN